jgi:hypothetical protein
VARDRERVLGCFEDTFQHKSFTGRSGTMYGYEGLGCIYWHMVAKLLVAVQENVLRGALSRGRDEAVTKLIDFYFRIRDGLGFRKTAAEYGAFPTDPYSHTPKHAGARQPGMTGQVKEEILSRFGELGVRVNDGIASFEPLLLAEEEFLKESTSYACFDLNDMPRSVELPAGSLAFSFCQTPIVYELTDNDAWIRVTDDRGTTEFSDGNRLSIEHSRALFARTGQITVIRVGVPVGSIRRPASGR